MRDLRFLGVLACFLLSGFAGLLYQTAWSRHFSFAFGTSSLAVATVLAAYMGGMAGGAALAGRFVDRVRRPLLTYGVLEAGIALSALTVPYAVEAAGWLRAAWLRSDQLPDEGGLGTAGFYLIVSFVVLCVPTGLMGATLPLLTRHAVREEEQIGRRVGALYTINTVGAVVGTICTAFWLLPALGLRATIWVGVATNGLVLLLAWLLARSTEETPPHSPDPSAAGLEGDSLSSRAAGFLAIAFGAGIASFTLEVLWTRLLEHVLGGSVYAFATMLASFLAGIALGAAVASRFATSSERAARGLAITQVGAGVLALAAYGWAQKLPAQAALLEQADPLTRLITLSAYGAAILLPCTICIGATFPFAVRAITAGAEASARASARVYAWNTLGAIVGSIGAGFFIIPWLGFEGTVTATIALNLALGLGAAILARPPSRAGLALVAAGAAALIWVAPEPPWALIRDHHGPLASKNLDPNTELFHYRSGRSATVLMVGEGQGFRLSTNGLPEAVIGRSGERPGTAMTARWLGALPALRPGGSESLLVIGLGGGVALESIPQSVREIDVIELEPEVLRANEIVAPMRARDPLADPRVRIHVNDARGALQLTDARWDAIVSQPSHPWTAGASHLYTREFQELVKSRLAPGGVYVQWIGVGFIDDSLLRSLSATLLSTFAHVRVYNTGGLLFLASDSPLATPAQEAAQIAAEPAAFARLGVAVVEDLASMLALGEVELRRVASGVPLIEDNDNLLANRSPLLVRKEARESIRELLHRNDPLIEKLAKLDAPYLLHRLMRTGQKQRARSLWSAIGGSVDRAEGSFEIDRGTGKQRQIIATLERALARDPSREDVRVRLLLADSRRRDPAVAEGLTPQSRAALSAIRLGQKEQWDKVAKLDGALATLPPRHPAYDQVLTARIGWRIHAKDQPTKALAEEAFALLETQAYGWSPVRHAYRALAAARSGKEAAAVSSLWDFTKSVTKANPRTAGAAKNALMALELLPDGALSPADRADLLGKIRGLASRELGANP